MLVNKKSLEKLRKLINEETEYRSGPKLVEFFNELGFRDSYSYGGGFPSRWIYTDEKLGKLNGNPELDTCIRKVFDPINFIERIADLDKLIADFNQYLAFDGWGVVRNGKEISFRRTDKIEFIKEKKPKNIEISETEFLKEEFSDISIINTGIDSVVQPIIEKRIEEIRKCLQIKAALSVVILCGSTLEGLLLGIALKHSEQFNKSGASPKEKDGKVKTFEKWTLANYIDVAYDIGLLKEDVMKFSHTLRNFRNYVHPYEQISHKFDPDEHTGMICFQVLKAAIYQLNRVQ